MKKKSKPSKAKRQKFPYMLKIHEIFSEYQEQIVEMPGRSFKVNNLMVDLRNRIVDLMSDIYQELYIELKNGITVKSNRNWKNPTCLIHVEADKCMICDEARVNNSCHIIPRESGGSDALGNIITLCANHHHLFDNARLSRGEFEMISMVGKDEGSNKYFQNVCRVRHEKFWENQSHPTEDPRA